MFSLTSQGNFNKTEKFLKFMQQGKAYDNLGAYGQKGVDSLAAATPVDTGETAHDWGHQEGHSNGTYSVTWFNTHDSDRGYVNIAVILQYGHGTGTGGYVPGRDYINPAMKPIFDKAVADVWRQVINA